MQHILPIEIIDLQGEGMHLFLKTKAGRKACRLLIDTGASRTVFDAERFQRLLPKAELQLLQQLSTGLGSNAVQSRAGSIPRLKLGDVVLKDFEVVVLDLSHVNQSYQQLGFPEIDGVLGSDVLFKMKAEIDYGRAQLRLIQE